MPIYLIPYLTPQCGICRRVLKSCLDPYNASLFTLNTARWYTSTHTLPHSVESGFAKGSWNPASLQCLIIYIQYCMPIYLIPYLTPQCGIRIWKRVLKSILNSQPIPFPTVWNQDLEKSLEIITLADIATSPTTVTPQCGIRIWKRVLKSCDLKCSMLIYLNPPIPYPTVWNQDLEKGLPHASLFIFNTACRYTSCLNGSLHSHLKRGFQGTKVHEYSLVSCVICRHQSPVHYSQA